MSLVSDNPRISVSTGDSRFRHLTIVSLTLLGYPFEGYIRAIQARSAMAHWDILSPTLLPLILRYCLVALSVLIAPALAGFPR